MTSMTVTRLRLNGVKGAKNTLAVVALHPQTMAVSYLINYRAYRFIAIMVQNPIRPSTINCTQSNPTE